MKSLHCEFILTLGLLVGLILSTHVSYAQDSDIPDGFTVYNDDQAHFTWLNKLEQNHKIVIGQLRLFRFKDPHYGLEVSISWKPDKDLSLPSVDVPRGFVTDFASIPSIFWTIMKPDDTDVIIPSIIHDYLYWDQTTTRLEADRIFYEVMIERGVNSWVAGPLYSAVRYGGESAWINNKTQKNKGLTKVVETFPDNTSTTWAEWRRQQ